MIAVYITFSESLAAEAYCSSWRENKIVRRQIIWEGCSLLFTFDNHWVIIFGAVIKSMPHVFIASPCWVLVVLLSFLVMVVPLIVKK